MERSITPQKKGYTSEMELHARHQKALDEFLRRALEGYEDRIERIILFGSVARGDARKNKYFLK
jgi:predicted nucleotidyltransferase